MSNALSDLYMRGKLNGMGSPVKPTIKKKGFTLIVAVLLVLTLVASAFAGTIYSTVQLKDDWGAKGVIILPLLGGDPDFGIRIDGSILLI